MKITVAIILLISGRLLSKHLIFVETMTIYHGKPPLNQFVRTLFREMTIFE